MTGVRDHAQAMRDALRMATDSVELPVGAQQVMVFALGGTLLALPLQVVRRVTPMAELAEPPACPSLVHGVLDLGGTAVPVLRLCRVLGLPEFEPGLDAHLIVLAGASPPLALAVERVLELVPLPSLLPTEVHTLNGCVAGAFLHRDRNVHLLDAARLLLAQEQHRLGELQVMAQARLLVVEAPT
jgi:chemotaxis signal transduction protein